MHKENSKFWLNVILFILITAAFVALGFGLQSLLEHYARYLGTIVAQAYTD